MIGQWNRWKWMKWGVAGVCATMMALTPAIAEETAETAEKEAEADDGTVPDMDTAPARDDGFLQPPTIVENRIYSLEGKADLGLFFDFTLKNRLTDHIGGGLVLGYHFNENFGVELMAAGGLAGSTSLATGIRQKVTVTAPTAGAADPTGDDLAGSGAFVAGGAVSLRWTPIYGKLSLSSELPLHFNFYFTVGLGAAAVKYNSVRVCAQNLNATETRCPGASSTTVDAKTLAAAFKDETKVSPAANLGGGLRLYFTDQIAFRVELRDLIYLDTFKTGINFRKPMTTPGTDSTGIGQFPLVMIGVGLVL